MRFTNELSRHIGWVRRMIGSHKYDQSERGIILPGGLVQCSGFYSFSHNKGPWSEPEANLLPTQGLIWFLNLFGNHSATFVQPYIALHANATTPLATHVASGYTSTFAEITSGSEGYSESTRVAWASAAASVTAVEHNNASPAEFTIVTASTLAVNGCAMLTASAKGATTGNLISASVFGATRNFSNTDLFDVKYQLGFTSS